MNNKAIPKRLTNRELAKRAALRYGQMERKAFQRAESAQDEAERIAALSAAEIHGDNASRAWSQYFSVI